MIDWLMEPLSLGESLAQWACVAAAGTVAAGIVRMAVSAHREDQVAAELGLPLASVVEFPRAKKEAGDELDAVALELFGDRVGMGREAGAGAGEPDRGDLGDEPDAVVLPFLPRAERAARRGGWSA